MKRIFLTLSTISMCSLLQFTFAQRGYYDAPYTRYEADSALLENGAIVLPKSYAQVDLQSEASNQVCVDMSSEGASAEFIFSEPADGMVVRYSVPDGTTATVAVYSGDEKIATLSLTSKWSWESLWNNGDPNNVGITNKNPKMRFDEVRCKLPEKISKVKLVKESGVFSLDFIEMEPVPAPVEAPENAAVYNGDGSTLQAFVDANGSKTIFIPAGIYNINSQIYIGVPDTKLQGAGMWYTQLNFTVTNESNGGLRANAAGVCYSDLFLTTEMTTRTKGYGGIHGVYTQGSVIRNVWVEHCATGAWIGQYAQGGPAYADGFLISNCRFRNTYADGINLCKGTRNAIVEHCNFRNNGDDGMAVWSADGLECINNTFRYNTVENGWRAAGAALYGGKDNKFYNIIIKDNVEIGITVTNTFPGVGFNADGLHDFHNVTLIGCGTFNDTNNSRVGAINIYHANSAGTKVRNVRFYNIDIIDSKCDALRIAKSSGEGIFNLIFENISINRTGAEYPFNNINNYTAQRGFAVYFDKYPLGNATYCNLGYENLGGNVAGAVFSTTQKGSFSWTELSGCEPAEVFGVSISPADTSISGGAKIQFVPVFFPANATNKIVTFTCDNPNVAKVDYDGRVTGLSKGVANITVTTQDGNFSATGRIEVTNTPLTAYKIKNRWQNTFLYDGGDRVKYSATAGSDSYLWLFEEVDGVKEIKNLSTGDYMHIEDLTGFVQCTERISGGQSSKWLIEDAGSGFVRLKSDLNQQAYIHIENLQTYAQYGSIEPAWWSAMWTLEPEIVTLAKELSIREKAAIFPNPSNGDFTLELTQFSDNEKVVVSVFNIDGRKIYSKEYNFIKNSNFVSLEISLAQMLADGNYFVQVAGETKVLTAKLLINR